MSGRAIWRMNTILGVMDGHHDHFHIAVANDSSNKILQRNDSYEGYRHFVFFKYSIRCIKTENRFLKSHKFNV